MLAGNPLSQNLTPAMSPYLHHVRGCWVSLLHDWLHELHGAVCCHGCHLRGHHAGTHLHAAHWGLRGRLGTCGATHGNTQHINIGVADCLTEGAVSGSLCLCRCGLEPGA